MMTRKTRPAPRRGQQQGAALIVGLILLLVATIVTLASMRDTGMQERMTANQDLKAVSQMAAESGATAFMQWASNPTTVAGANTWQAVIPTAAAGNPNVGTKGYFFANPADVSWNGNQVTAKITGLAKADNSADALSRSFVRVTASLPTPGGPNPIFGAGLLADNDIDIHGNAQLNGSAHANGNFGVTGGNSSHTGGTLSAGGTVSMSGADSANIRQGAAQVEVPAVTSDYLASMQAAAYQQSCNLNLSGDQGGKIYYCNGNASVSGSHSNVTIVASGNITYNGSGTRGGTGKSGTAVTVAIVAGGGITFNGSGTAYGIFWSNGGYTHNGSGEVKGTVISGGGITRNGVFNFEQIEEFDNDGLPNSSPTPFRIGAWTEVLE